MKTSFFYGPLSLLAILTTPILSAPFPTTSNNPAITAAQHPTPQVSQMTHRSVESTKLARRALDFFIGRRSDWSFLFGNSDLEPGSYGDYDGDDEDAVAGK